MQKRWFGVLMLAGLIGWGCSPSAEDLQEKTRNIEKLDEKISHAKAMGNLGLLRSASAQYYGETNGKYPQVEGDFVRFLDAKEIPLLELNEHEASREIRFIYDDVCLSYSDLDTSKIEDSGRWGYVANQSSKCYGKIFIECIHISARGAPYYKY